ncbi:hypothetical protein FRB93_003049 [Tulasnella sp. JGI-2019a]|nr:hypothetical protein FRB93_003049 [Tulasnella sp. JGI-2019a]
MSTTEVAIDDIERVALALPPPKKSLRSSYTTQVVKGRAQLLNCQSWLRELVVSLVKNGIVPGTAVAAMDGAPEN